MRETINYEIIEIDNGFLVDPVGYNAKHDLGQRKATYFATRPEAISFIIKDIEEMITERGKIVMKEGE
jgi:hypothetical protein